MKKGKGNETGTVKNEEKKYLGKKVGRKLDGVSVLKSYMRLCPDASTNALFSVK